MTASAPNLSNNTLWAPALRRTMMRVRPDFFGWSCAERERYGVAIPKADAEEIDRVLLKELFEADRARGDLELNRFNETILPLLGIGEDCFYLNEWLGDGVTLLDFATLRDYDHDDFLFQEKSRREADAGYAGRPYRGTLDFCWARLFVDRRFTYASLSMAAGFLLAQLEEQALATLDALVPHRFVPGRDHGKREGVGYAWDMRVDADGKEAVLEDLQALVFDYERRRHDELAELWDRTAAKGVFIRQQDSADESNADFVFASTAALEAVHFRTFVRDCRAIARPFDELDRQARSELALLEARLREEHQRLLQTFDPNVVRLRRRRKVLIHRGAADELL
jgi:hypothetical protein